MGVRSVHTQNIGLFVGYYTFKISIPMDDKYSQHDDETLISMVQAGNQEAFAEIVHRHSKRFYRIAYRILFLKDDSEDVVQEAFLKLWERRLLWNPNKNTKFTTWFYKIVVNLSLDHNRKKKPLHVSEHIQYADSKPLHEEKLDEKQKHEILDRFIRELPVRQQMALNLCFYEGLSNQEAADIMEVKLKALQSLIMRAKMSLKEKVQYYLD